MIEGDELVKEEFMGDWVTRTYRDADGREYVELSNLFDELKKLLAEKDELIDQLTARLKELEGIK